VKIGIIAKEKGRIYSLPEKSQEIVIKVLARRVLNKDKLVH
jgi:hypothetical protein